MSSLWSRCLTTPVDLVYFYFIVGLLIIDLIFIYFVSDHCISGIMPFEMSIIRTPYLLHDVRDIKCKYGFLE